MMRNYKNYFDTQNLKKVWWEKLEQTYILWDKQTSYRFLLLRQYYGNLLLAISKLFTLF